MARSLLLRYAISLQCNLVVIRWFLRFTVLSMFIFLKCEDFHVLQDGVSSKLTSLETCSSASRSCSRVCVCNCSKAILCTPISLSHPPILYVRGLFLHVLSLAHPEVLSQLCALDLQ